MILTLALPLRLPPGQWDLLLRFGRSVPLVRIDDVTAEGGIENHDPRLMELDWPSFASVATLKITTPDGKPCDECTVWHTSGDVSDRCTPKDGMVRILVPKEGGPLKLQHRDPKLGILDLGVVKGERAVVFAPGPLVRVSLSRMPQLPAGVSLTARMVGGNDPEGLPAAFDGQGVAEVRAPSVGTWRIELHVGNRFSASRIRFASPPREIGADGIEHRITVTDELMRAIGEAAAVYGR